MIFVWAIETVGTKREWHLPVRIDSFQLLFILHSPHSQHYATQFYRHVTVASTWFSIQMVLYRLSSDNSCPLRILVFWNPLESVVHYICHCWMPKMNCTASPENYFRFLVEPFLHNIHTNDCAHKWWSNSLVAMLVVYAINSNIKINLQSERKWNPFIAHTHSDRSQRRQYCCECPKCPHWNEWYRRNRHRRVVDQSVVRLRWNTAEPDHSLWFEALVSQSAHGIDVRQSHKCVHQANDLRVT